MKAKIDGDSPHGSGYSAPQPLNAVIPAAKVRLVLDRPSASPNPRGPPNLETLIDPSPPQKTF